MEDRIVLYRSFYNPIEANIVKAKLEDNEIPCFLTDENILTINPLFNQAVGGVKLNVFFRDVERINMLLAEELELSGLDSEDHNSGVVCEKCQSTNVGYGQATENRFKWWVTIVSLVLAVYPFSANKCYHCYTCGHEFK